MYTNTLTYIANAKQREKNSLILSDVLYASVDKLKLRFENNARHSNDADNEKIDRQKTECGTF